MAAPAILLACVARAAAKHVGNFFTFGLAGDILVDAWDAYQRCTEESARRKEVEALAAASHAEAREAAKCAVADLRGLSPEDGARLVEVLARAPDDIRRSLRGSADPSGRTMTPGRRLAGKDDLRAVLPLAPTRFKSGDRPLPGVDWELAELLGVGGFGEVWLARNHHVPTMKPVVLKFCLDAEARKRLLKHEARIIGQVQAQGVLPGIVPLLHSYLSADPPCLEFEYVEDGDLASLIRDQGTAGVAPLDAARLIQGLATTIGQAHRLRPAVAHRDIKPSNILCRRMSDGTLSHRITDFGIGGLAVLQATHQTRRNSESPDRTMTMDGSYTPLYASPQQMAGETADPRDDVYSLGVVWYQMLTGDLNKGAPTGDAWKARLRARGMTAELVRVLAPCMEHEREDRPANGDDLAARIESAVAPVIPPVIQAKRNPPKPAKQSNRQDSNDVAESRAVRVQPANASTGLSRRALLSVAAGAGVAVVASCGGLAWWMMGSGERVSRNNLLLIGQAVHAYHSVNLRLPGNVMDKDGKPLLSWRVQLLPYLEQDSLYKEFNLNEVWDSTHNLRLVEKMPEVFASPRFTGAKSGYTVYQVFSGPGALFRQGQVPYGMDSVVDGTSYTILAVESSSPVPWSKPEDIPFDKDKAVPDFGKAYGDKPLAVLLDGSIRVLDLAKIKPATMKNAITPDGGEVLGSDW